MRYPLVPTLFLSVFVAPAATGQISIVDQTRYVECTATAADDFGNPPVTNSDRVDALGHGAFVETLVVSTTVPMSFQSATSRATATQNSSLGATSLVATGTAFGSGNAPDPGGIASHSSISRSSFEVTFDLLTSADYALVGEIDASQSASASVVLVSAAGVTIVDVPHPGTNYTTPFSHVGTLAPGRYTLTARARGGAFGNGWWDFNDYAGYDLDFDVVPLPVGEKDCAPPSANSSGTSASIGALGSNLLAEADLTLTANGAVPGQFGLFFYGAPGAPTPFGAGTLCLAGPLFRLSAPLQVDVFGLASHAVDFGAWPVNAGAGAWTVGSTWAFQFWYRDPGAAAGFTASDRLTVEFF